MTNRALKGKIVLVFGTQADFSQAIGLDESFVSRVVNGRRQLPPEEQQRWASALECDPGEIFKETRA